MPISFQKGLAALALVGVLASPAAVFASHNDNLLIGSWIKLGPVRTTSDSRLVLEEREECNGSRCTRQAALFRQDVTIKNHAGDYALMIAYTRAEKIRSNDIAGLPYLYGYFLEKDGSVEQYLQGQSMRHTGTKNNTWNVSYGLFKIPSDAYTLRFFLKQASRKGTTQDGRDAEFYKPGLYIVEDKNDAMDIVDDYEDHLNFAP